MTPGERHHHIRGVVGPDEYHHAVNDNAYTNWMARFNLERAAGRRSAARLHAGGGAGVERPGALAVLPGPGADGVIEQFEGFFALEDYPLPKEERFKAPMSRLFDWEEINRLKLLKQADVLMLPLLFPDAFSDEVVAANYRYYEPLTDHGSSLSPAVHAAIAARIGLSEDAQRYWKQSLWLDLSDAMDNSMLGVHPAAMGGTWQALVFGFLGVRFTEAGPQADARRGEGCPRMGGRRADARVARPLVRREGGAHMSRFDSILLPLDGSPEAAKAAGCALWLAQALGATLHVLHATAHPLPRGTRWPACACRTRGGRRVVVHQLPGERRSGGARGDRRPSHRPRRDERARRIGLGARGFSAGLGSVARAVLERSPVPVVLLPARYRESLPWTSMLAAASGEAAADRALRFAVRLAAALRLKVTVVHCRGWARRRGAPPLGRYADAPHHEYPRRLEQMVQRGLAGCAAEEAAASTRSCCAAAIRRRCCSSRRHAWQQRSGARLARRARRRTCAGAQAPAGRSRMRAARREGPERSARLKVGSDIDEV